MRDFIDRVIRWVVPSDHQLIEEHILCDVIGYPLVCPSNGWQ